MTDKTINIVCDSEIKVSNTQTGTVYTDEEEAQADVVNPNTSTRAEHIRRDVKIIVPPIDFGSIESS
jgi:hypothetical protein